MSAVVTRARVLATGSVFDPLYTALGYVLAWLYAIFPSYAVAIMLLTVAVRLVLYPLTVKQTKSMQAMQRLQPEIKRVQQKYKQDRQKQNEEVMKLYKEHKINPLAGCLPLLLQMPLFIVLYRLIHDLTGTIIAGAIVVGGVGAPAPALSQATVTNVKVSSGTIEKGKLTQASVTGDVVGADGKVVGVLDGAVTDNAVHGPKVTDPAPVKDATGKVIGSIQGATVRDFSKEANPKHIPKDSDLYKNLRKTPGKMISWGMDLAKRPSQGKGAEVIGLYLLVALTVVTGYYQQRQMTARTPASAQNPQTQMMGRIFPLFFGFISLQVPAGVVLYFVVSNLWQIGQQAIIFRQQDVTPRAGGGGTAGTKPAVPAGPPPGNPAKGGNSEKKPPAAAKSGNPSGGGGGSNRSRRRRRRRKGR